ncbi:MAG TPA: protease inhibitor I42 family protein [Candidatus Anoxymicrobiaceae bacterium]|jgi:predicted secreted protein
MRRSRLLVVGLAGLLVAVMMVAGCGSSTTSTPSSTPTNQNIVGSVTGESVQAFAGSDFKVSLASNPTTGYVWSITTPPSSAVVTQKGSSTFISSTTSTAVVGAGGLEVWTFHAVAAGTTQIVFTNQQAQSASGAQPAQTHVVSVQVVAKPTKPVSPPKTYTNPATPINETVGREFKINVPEQTASTGFKWLLASSYNHKVCVFEGVTFLAASSQVGAAQTEVWRFLATGAGTTKLVFNYVQPFDKTTPPAKTLTFTVNVK